MHEDRKLGIPTKHYIDVCLEGYKAFGFNPVRLLEAINLSKEDVKNGNH